MGLLGLAMRLTQADVLSISPAWFYRLMTAARRRDADRRAAGDDGRALVRAAAGRAVSAGRMLASYALIVVGAVAVVVASSPGGFATGWTFLSRCPSIRPGSGPPGRRPSSSSGCSWWEWASSSTAWTCSQPPPHLRRAVRDARHPVPARTRRRRRRRPRSSPPPPSSIEGLLASAAGTTILIALIGRTIDSGVELDALWAKNLTYFFGHSIANLIIYLAAGALYVLVPRYAGRPWKTTKPIVVGWLGHAGDRRHRLLAPPLHGLRPADGAQLVSTTASFAAALPVAVVTIYTG